MNEVRHSAIIASMLANRCFYAIRCKPVVSRCEPNYCVASFDVGSVFTDFNQVERYCDGHLNSTEIRSVTKTSGLAYSLHQERYESKHGTGSNFRSATHSPRAFHWVEAVSPQSGRRCLAIRGSSDALYCDISR